MKRKTKYKVIKTIEELKKLASDGLDCFIVLNYGLRSSKFINWTGEKFKILNLIDGSRQTLSEKQLMDKSWTNIGEALKKKALIYEK